LSPKFTLRALFIISLIALLAYSNTFYAEMQFDDTLQIVARQQVNHLSNFSSISDWSDINKRPLAFFSFALNYYFGAYHVFGYHLVNLIIHLLTALVLFLLSQFIFARIFKSNQQQTINIAALFTALIFVSHPIQTQAVTYIVQRMTSLATLFYLSSVWCYARGRKLHISTSVSKALIYYLLSLVAFILSLLSKQIAVTLPFALLLFEFFFIRDKHGKPFTKYIVVSFSAILIAILLFLLFGQLPRQTEEISRYDYLLTQFRVIVKYFQLLVLPINQNLDYNFQLSTSLFGWKEISSLFFILALIFSAVFLRKKEPAYAFGVLWIFLTLAVESSIIPIEDVLFEHRLYLPMAGFSILVSGLAVKYIRPGYLYLLMITVIISLTAASRSRNRVWKTQRSLWTDVTNKSPNYARPWYNLGKVSYQDGNITDCIKYSKKSLEIEPNNPKAWYNIGLCNEQLEKDELAIQFYRKSLEYDSVFGRSLNNLGSIYIEKKKFNVAIDYLLKALRSNSKQPSILQNLSIAYFNSGNYSLAIKYNKKYLKIKPNDATIISDIGLAYLQLKDFENAKGWLEKAIKINPNIIKSYINLGSCNFQTGDYRAAAKQYEKALRIEPDNPLALKYLALAKQRIR